MGFGIFFHWKFDYCFRAALSYLPDLTLTEAGSYTIPVNMTAFANIGDITYDIFSPWNGKSEGA
jgi:hypothetical protein